MRFLVTLELDAPDDADPQGIKGKVAMDFEKYGGVRVVKVERVEEYQQMTMKANEIANLKADADALRNKLADTEAALGRANSEMAALRHDLTCEQESSAHLASVCRWLSDHPWRNLWALAKRKLGGERNEHVS